MASIMGLCRRFDTREKCINFLEGLRWPDGISCPRCQSDSISTISTRCKHECNTCRYQFSVTAGTIFHRTHLPLQKWLVATLLIVNAKKGISAKQLERDLDVTYKTAWYLAHRIRRAMKDSTVIRKMQGIIEVDDTYVGGKSHGGKRGRGAPKKVMCGGALERGGWVTARVLENGTTAEVCRPIRQAVDHKKVDMVCADEYAGYNQLQREFHLQRVCHSTGEYVRGPVHINGIENFWGLFKRGIIGSFHKISRKYMQFYLDEFTYRHSWTARGRPMASKGSNGAFMEKVLSNALIHDPAIKG